MRMEDRIGALERKARILQRCVAVLVGMVSLLLLSGQGKPGTTVEAERFVLRGKEGDVVGEWRVGEQDPVLTMRASGTAVNIGIGKEGPALALSGPERGSKVSIRGGRNPSISASAGGTSIGYGINAGQPGMTWERRAGTVTRPIFALACGPAGLQALFFSESGRPVAQFPSHD